MRRATGPIVLASLVAIAISGCGDSGGSSDSGRASNGTATPTATATTTPTPDRAADRGIARESTLKLEDFPSGWTEADDDAAGKAQCEQVKAARAATTARAESSRFGNGESTEAQNYIYVFADEAGAVKAFEQLAAKDTRLCYAKAVTDALKEAGQLDVGDAKSARVSIDPLGDQRDAGRVTVPVSTEGVKVDVLVDLVFVRVDRGISLGLFIDVFSPFDEDLRNQLTATTVRRLSDNLAA